MQIFVISLKSSVQRRKYISEQFNRLGLEFSFFDAYLGKDYYNNPDYYNDRKAKKSNHCSLKVGEVGCALSHNAVYKKIVEEQIPYALICEDDIVVSEDLPAVLEKLEQNLTGSKIITLDRCDVYKKKTAKELYKNYFIAEPHYIREGGMANASGYIITYEAAKAICSINYPVWFAADSWGRYLKYVNFFGIIPTQSIIHQNKKKFLSTIQSDGINNEVSSENENDIIECFTEKQLFFYGLKTYVPVTSHLYRFVRWVYRHTLKKFKCNAE